MNLWLPGQKENGKGIVRKFGLDMHTLYCQEMDNQQGPTAEHCIELCSTRHVAAWMAGSLGENGYKHVHGWVLSCAPETISTLLIGCNPIQNKKFKRKIFPCVQGNKNFCSPRAASF